MNNIFSIIKGSITLVVLFCFVAVGQVFGTICVSDTIIIDGKTVVVERVVEYEKPVVDDGDDEPKKPKKDIRHTSYFGGGIGPSMLLVNREVPNSEYQTLNQFIGCEGNARVGVRANGVFGWKWKKFGVEIAPSLDLEWYKNQYFAESELDDSLYQFSSTENCVLNQITRHDLLIGVEFYDVEADLHRGPLFMMNLHLPINGVYYHRLNRTKHLEFRAGVGPYWTLNLKGGPIVLLNEVAKIENEQVLFEYVSASDLKSRMAVKSIISVDWVIQPDHGVESYIAIGAWFSPSVTPHFVENALYNQTVTRFGVRVSFNTFLKRNRNKVAQ